LTYNCVLANHFYFLFSSLFYIFVKSLLFYAAFFVCLTLHCFVCATFELKNEKKKGKKYNYISECYKSLSDFSCSHAFLPFHEKEFPCYVFILTFISVMEFKPKNIQFFTPRSHIKQMFLYLRWSTWSRMWYVWKLRIKNCYQVSITYVVCYFRAELKVNSPQNAYALNKPNKFVTNLKFK